MLKKLRQFGRLTDGKPGAQFERNLEYRIGDLLDDQSGLRVSNCYLEVLPGMTGVVAWVLPGVLPGVTWRYLESWSVTWCYLGVIWVGIGRWG